MDESETLQHAQVTISGVIDRAAAAANGASGSTTYVVPADGSSAPSGPMTSDQADRLITLAQYTHADLGNVVAYQAASWYLDGGIFVAVVVLVAVVGILGRPRASS